MRGWLVAAVLGLGGCSVSWDLNRPSDVTEDVLQFLFLRYDAGEPDEVRGPHAVGSTIDVEARRQGPGTLVGWSFEAFPAEVVSLVDVLEDDDDPDRVVLRVRFEGEGEGTLQAINKLGGVGGRIGVVARTVATAELSAYDDLVTRRDEVVGADQTLAIAETGAVSLTTAWLDADDTLLTGSGIVGTALAEGGDTLVSVDEDYLVVRNLDTFTMRGLAAGTTALTVSAAGTDIATWSLDVVPLADLDSVSIDVVSLGKDDPDEGDLIGYVRSLVSVDGRRVLGTPLAWSREGEALGSGTYARVRESPGEQAEITACVPDTQVCASRMVNGHVEDIGSAVAPPCSCGHVGSGSASGVLVGLLALWRRRRSTISA
ncbi:MAG: hypothetical protein H6733_01445 [Alphaproteobacteria bacterium]|nr:hypothetical protein [Alphaproteobacteria bacterium]